MVGLGRMGANMTERLRAAGHEVKTFDPNVEGTASSPAELVRQLDAPRSVWLMVPAGIVDSVVGELAPHLAEGDTIIDGGNSYYVDDLRRSGKLGGQGIHYVDVGVSGGVWGRERGYCLMVGGDDEAVGRLTPVLEALAPGVDSAPRTPGRSGDASPDEQGWLHCGPSGAGHFVKMVHNGIEYGLMQAYAEGLNVLKHADVGLRAQETDAETTPLRDPELYKYELDIANCAIRRGSTAAWIGLDWLGDSDVSQLVCLGPNLYNGACGIAVFLAAYSVVTGHTLSGELALAALAQIRKDLRSRNAARKVRSLGLGAATGLGSIIYALTTISKSLGDKSLLADAMGAVELITDDLIAADKQLDVMDGSAGAILCLHRLYRETNSSDVLRRAAYCGEHLLRQRRVAQEGHKSWIGQGFGSHGLNGMSHGAAGFAYALASLSAATGREEFAQAASECIEFEDSSYDEKRHNWPDLRGGGEPQWASQWCHGAPGIGLARIATSKQGVLDVRPLVRDISQALVGTEQGWPTRLDTLCCGTFGCIEFLRGASSILARTDLRELASQRLMGIVEAARLNGDYRWNGGSRRFNLGLFRGARRRRLYSAAGGRQLAPQCLNLGIAGVGSLPHSCKNQIDPHRPISSARRERDVQQHTTVRLLILL